MLILRQPLRIYRFFSPSISSPPSPSFISSSLRRFRADADSQPSFFAVIFAACASCHSLSGICFSFMFFALIADDICRCAADASPSAAVSPSPLSAFHALYALPMITFFCPRFEPPPAAAVSTRFVRAAFHASARQPADAADAPPALPIAEAAAAFFADSSPSIFAAPAAMPSHASRLAPPLRLCRFTMPHMPLILSVFFTLSVCLPLSLALIVAFIFFCD